MDNSSSISDIINTIEKKHENLPLIYVALMEQFSTHLPSYKNLTEQSDEFETAVEYYNEFIRIINNAKIGDYMICFPIIVSLFLIYLLVDISDDSILISNIIIEKN